MRTVRKRHVRAQLNLYPTLLNKSSMHQEREENEHAVS